MAIKWIRIDDRLIHGQVATSWLRHVNADQIICISDKAVNNPVQIQVLKMAAPDLRVHVFGVNQFIDIFNKNPINRSTFLIAESLSDVLKYSHDLCFTLDEEEALNTLLDKGVKVEYQIAAFDAPSSLLSILEKAKSDN